MTGRNIHKSITVGVDARPLIHPFNGNAQYLYKMLSELIRQKPENKWVLFSHRPLHEYFNGLFLNKNVTVSLNSSALFHAGPVWVHMKLVQEIKKHNCDLFWGTLAMLPVFYKKRTAIPSLVNFHDLNAFSAPETMTCWNKLQHRFLDGHTLKNASCILCLSETTKADIQKYFPDIPVSKFQVVYPGCELQVGKPTRPEGLTGDRFFLSVGTLEPRKNQRTLIEAYMMALKLDGSIPDLVIIGKKGWGEDSLYEELKSGKFGSKVIYLENASMEELTFCYKKAVFCALPSLHEGFGLPVIEASSYGKISLVSDIPIFKEICASCEFVSPFDVKRWTEAILKLSKRKKQPSPSFDRNIWSWKRRAAFLSEIMDSFY